MDLGPKTDPDLVAAVVALLEESLKYAPSRTVRVSTERAALVKKGRHWISFTKNVDASDGVEYLRATLKGGFTIEEREGVKGIRCERCKFISFHPKDVDEKYCANCNIFHIDTLPTPTPAQQAGKRVFEFTAK